MNLDVLRGKMAERNVTQADIAKHLDLSERTISLKINGKIDFKVSELNSIAEYLGVEPNIFLP